MAKLDYLQIRHCVIDIALYLPGILILLNIIRVVLAHIV